MRRSHQPRRPVKVSPTKADAERTMAAIDAMPEGFRLLVHEFGFVIVQAMFEEGFRDPQEVYMMLEDRRLRRQAEWLARQDVFLRRESFGI